LWAFTLTCVFTAIPIAAGLPNVLSFQCSSSLSLDFT
jgi:hypothetical protein